MTRFNLDRSGLEDVPDVPEGFGLRDADIGSAIGGVHLGGSVIEIQPGRSAWPYHWEAAQEEWLIVLEGTPWSGRRRARSRSRAATSSAS